MLACTKDRLSIVQTLVSCGASLNLTNKDGWTPLHIACRQGNPDIVSCLLDTAPQCWDTTSKNGRTPLHTAGMCSYTHCGGAKNVSSLIWYPSFLQLFTEG